MNLTVYVRASLWPYLLGFTQLLGITIIWASHLLGGHFIWAVPGRSRDYVTSGGSSLWSGTRLLQWKRSSKETYLNNAWNWPDMHNHYSGPRHPLF